MDTAITKRENGKEYNKHGSEVIDCTLCNTNKTTMLGSKLCDGCWELKKRITADPALARKILKNL